jgi:hypothetical protein
MNSDAWVQKVQKRVKSFAREHGHAYAMNERQLSAAFEIGCFHALLDFYGRHFRVDPQGLQNGEYRYLTTPAGNPRNFSFVKLIGKTGTYIVRQQVRVRSVVDEDIQFTPDFVVHREEVKVNDEVDEDYANGKKRLFFVKGEELIAVHECKSTNPFPELVIAFLGMLVAAHPWANQSDAMQRLKKDGKHLAPSLFVGGRARGLHQRMVAAMAKNYPVNIIVGMHYGTWQLFDEGKALNLIDDPKTIRPTLLRVRFGESMRRLSLPTPHTRAPHGH